MPKQVNLLPNLRVDIPDFSQQTSGLSIGGQKHLLERAIQANYPAIVDGFRVEVAPQGSAPRMLTVYNGIGFDRSGAILNNEDDYAASRSITLPANGTFYVEVELVTNASDPDARGFWDPTYSNGTDTPSGDTLPKGREFNENVATRLTPDWRIVSPVSTTGFEINTNPDSVRIPVAQLTVSGLVISGASTTPWRSVLRETLTASSTKAKFFDTRGMPDTFTLRLDPGGFDEEDVNVTANDRENSILTLSSAPGFEHPAGERGAVQAPTPAQFVVQGTTADKRPRMFQGDVDRGHLVNLNPQSNVAGGTSERERSDQQISSLKAYVDFLSAQLRELKFGHFTQVGTGGTPPPFSDFDTRHSYWDSAGGVLGARTNTISVGNGTTSWGDYNLEQYLEENVGSVASDMFQAVTNQLNFSMNIGGSAGGGVVFLKRGVYEVDGTAFTSSNLTLIGEGRDETIVNITGTFPFLDIDGGSTLTLKDLTIIRSTGTSAYAINFTAGRFIAENCRIGGLSGSIAGGSLKDVVIGDSETPVTASISDMVWENVDVTCVSTSALHVAWNSASVFNSVFKRCSFTSSGTAINVMCYLGSVSSVTFERCFFDVAATDKIGIYITSDISTTTFRDCDLSGSASAADFTIASVFRVGFENCTLSHGFNNSTALKLGTGAEYVWVRGCYCVQGGSYTGGQQSGAISGTNASKIWIEDCDFFDNDKAINLTAPTQVRIKNNNFRSGSVPGRFAINFPTGSITHVLIEGNRFIDYTADATDVKVINIQDTSGKSAVASLQIRGNTFRNIGGTTSARDNTRCVDLTNVSTSSLAYGVVITENYFDNVQAKTTLYAITGSYLANARVSGNHFVFVGTATSTLTAFGAIRLTDTAGCVVEGNLLDGIGNDNVAASGDAIIHVNKTEADPGSTRNHVVISNNVLHFIRPNGILAAGIRLTNVGSHATITGNVVDLSTLGVGIKIDDADTGADNPQIYNLTIANNTITGGNNATFGMHIIFGRNTAFVGGRIAVSGNAISDCLRGIIVSGANARARGIALTGNNIYTSLDGGGIYLSFCEGFTINGNQIQIINTAGTACIGISVENCLFGTVTGNNVIVTNNDATSIGIDVHQEDNHGITVSGNTVRYGNNATAIASFGIWVPDDVSNSGTVVFCASNTVIKDTAGSGTGISIRRIGDTDGMTVDNKARAQTRAQGLAIPESTDFTPLVPADFAEIGLNFRVD